jgi:hypothetical protein
MELRKPNHKRGRPYRRFFRLRQGFGTSAAGVDCEVTTASDSAATNPASEVISIASTQRDVFFEHTDSVSSWMLHTITDYHSEYSVWYVFGGLHDALRRYPSDDSSRQCVLCGVQHHPRGIRISVWFHRDLFSGDRDCFCAGSFDLSYMG